MRYCFQTGLANEKAYFNDHDTLLFGTVCLDGSLCEDFPEDIARLVKMIAAFLRKERKMSSYEATIRVNENDEEISDYVMDGHFPTGASGPNLLELRGLVEDTEVKFSTQPMERLCRQSVDSSRCTLWLGNTIIAGYLLTRRA